jgi:hypothetical protein
MCIKPMLELSKQHKKLIKQLLTMLNKSQETKQIQSETPKKIMTVLHSNPLAVQLIAHLLHLTFHILSNTLHDKYTLH